MSYILQSYHFIQNQFHAARWIQGYGGWEFVFKAFGVGLVGPIAQFYRQTYTLVLALQSWYRIQQYFVIMFGYCVEKRFCDKIWVMSFPEYWNMCKNLLQGVRTMLRRNTPQRSGLRGVRTTYELVTAQAVNLKLAKLRKDREFWNFLSHYLVQWNWMAKIDQNKRDKLKFLSRSPHPKKNISCS